MSISSRVLSVVALGVGLAMGPAVAAGASAEAPPYATTRDTPAPLPALDMAAGDAAAAIAAREAIVGRILELGHSKAHVRNWRRMLAGQSASMGDDLGSSELRQRVRNAWGAAVDQGFDIETLMASWRQRLAASASSPDLDMQLAFETSPLGRRLNDMSAAAAEDNPPAEISARRMAEAQRALARDPGRALLLQRVLVAAHIEEATLELMSSLQLATAVGAIDATPADKPRADLADVVAVSERYRALVKAQLAQTLVANYAQVWSELSSAELERYAHHLEQPDTQRLMRASAAIYSNLMRDAALSIGRAFARELHSEQL